MKRALLIACLLAARPLYGAMPEPGLEIKGYISSWTQDCAGKTCSLPKPGERNIPVTLSLGLPVSPGAASVVNAAETLKLPDGSDLSVSLDLYAVCPYAGLDNCAGRYFQAQVSLSGPGGAFCAAALNPGDFTPFPVLMCPGVRPDGTRFGITLHRQPF